MSQENFDLHVIFKGVKYLALLLSVSLIAIEWNI